MSKVLGGIELAGEVVTRRSPSPLILSLGERKPISPVLMIVLKTLVIQDVVSSNEILNYTKTTIAVSLYPRERD